MDFSVTQQQQQEESLILGVGCLFSLSLFFPANNQITLSFLQGVFSESFLQGAFFNINFAGHHILIPFSLLQGA